MTVDELITQIRYQINDTDKVEYSDDELKNYINEALDWLSGELIKLAAPCMMKKTTVTLTDGEGDLPSDFVREAAVIAGDWVLESIAPFQEPDRYTYNIYGNKIFSNNDSVTLYYYAAYSHISNVSDDLPVPDYMINLLRQIVIFLALNRNEFNTTVEQALTQAFSDQVLRLAAMQGGSNYEYSLPWKV